jgi:5-methylcytosine-specific restriction protein A
MPKMPKPFRPRHLQQAAKQSQAEYDRRRGPGRQFYGCKTWRKFRAWFLSVHPLCQDCEQAGRITPAREVHHALKRTEHPENTYDPEACRALCSPCHVRRTRKGE